MALSCRALAPIQRRPAIGSNPDTALVELAHGPLRFGQPAFARCVDQLQRAHGVAGDAIPGVVGQTEVEAGEGVALISGLLPQLSRLGRVEVHPAPLGVHQPEIGQGFGQAGGGIERRRTGFIPRNGPPGFVEQREGVFGLRAIRCVGVDQALPDGHGFFHAAVFDRVQPAGVGLRPGPGSADEQHEHSAQRHQPRVHHTSADPQFHGRLLMTRAEFVMV